MVLERVIWLIKHKVVLISNASAPSPTQQVEETEMPYGKFIKILYDLHVFGDYQTKTSHAL